MLRGRAAPLPRRGPRVPAVEARRSRRRDLRLPRTPTGTTLLGIVLHCANVEIGYFGPTFGRAWPEPDHPCLIPDDAYDLDPQADWWVPADIPAAEVIGFYRSAAGFCDVVFDELPLDAVGRVPWWPEERAEVRLHAIAVHVLTDIARHAGHADVLREQLDGAAGCARRRRTCPTASTGRRTSHGCGASPRASWTDTGSPREVPPSRLGPRCLARTLTTTLWRSPP